MSGCFAPGAVVAIRGESGIGKSTLAKLLVGVATPTAGSVTVDGHSVSFGMAGIGSVLQTDRLIEGTILENVLFYRSGFAIADVEAALATAKLLAFVRSLPMGYRTIVSDTVPLLSNGQRQRLLLARAILEKPKLLVLDEATSNLEVSMEREIIAALKNTGATIVIIAHRPEVWLIADEVYDFEKKGLFPCETVADSASERSGRDSPMTFQ